MVAHISNLVLESEAKLLKVQGQFNAVWAFLNYKITSSPKK